MPECNGVLEELILKKQKWCIRCHSEIQIDPTYWVQNPQCATPNLYAASNVTEINLAGDRRGDDPSLYVTWDVAKGICESVGARLCTRTEIRTGCPIDSGCVDNHLVWTSTMFIQVNSNAPSISHQPSHVTGEPSLIPSKSVCTTICLTIKE